MAILLPAGYVVVARSIPPASCLILSALPVLIWAIYRCRDCCSTYPILSCCPGPLIAVPLLPAECHVCSGPVTVPHTWPCAMHQRAPVCCLQRVLSAVGLSKAQPGSKRKAEPDEPADAPAPAAADAGGPPEASLEERTAARQPRGRPRKRQRRAASPQVQASSSLAHPVRLFPGAF